MTNVPTVLTLKTFYHQNIANSLDTSTEIVKFLKKYEICVFFEKKIIEFFGKKGVFFNIVL